MILAATLSAYRSNAILTDQEGSGSLYENCKKANQNFSLKRQTNPSGFI